ncbi:glycoside hydrolase family 3 N-terminal domain-containing protein, partial [Actinotignum timonense]|uniref:glycoside hydrolase family 3 N-terminal domain-containing protein n=1 Tax=Actinotignum timonense TaxID=1870995 RepID=UPI002A820FB3
MNIKRDPRCGRNFEYFSEDPFLTASMATAYVSGVQSRGVGTSLKHFAANNQETDRMRRDSQVDERTLREIYLRAFEKVVKDAAPWTIMCSYNSLNGTLVSENRWLLTTVLREEWGYEGVVVSDWGAVRDRRAALRAGLDLEMP